MRKKEYREQKGEIVRGRGGSERDESLDESREARDDSRDDAREAREALSISAISAAECVPE